MFLAVDIGNTNTVFAVCEGTEIVHSWRAQTIPEKTADEYAGFLNEVFRLTDLSWTDFDDVIVSSVVPVANRHVQELSEKYLSKTAIMITRDLAGVDVDLDHPDEVGADRLVNAVAVLSHYKAPAIVIDFGTATTFDVIDTEGRYLGGAIAPGVRLSVAALHEAAAKLPSVSIKEPKAPIGKNTVDAMQSGIFWGYVGMIERILNNIKSEMKTPPRVIATGGLAHMFFDHVDAIDNVDEDLLLKGMIEIYKREKS